MSSGSVLNKQPKKRGPRSRRAGGLLVTEIMIDGKLAGAVVWSEDRSSSVFVVKEDFRYFGETFTRLRGLVQERKGRV